MRLRSALRLSGAAVRSLGSTTLLSNHSPGKRYRNVSDWHPVGLAPAHRWRLRLGGSRTRQTDYDDPRANVHYPTRPVDKDKAEAELTLNIKKATSPEETAPKQKHVRSQSERS